MDCIFCKDFIRANAVLENPLAFVIYDKYPKEQGHVLVIPKRHSENWFQATGEERVAIAELLDAAKNMLDEKFQPAGFNVVMNCGKEAGQEVFHTHVHLIPRYRK